RNDARPEFLDDIDPTGTGSFGQHSPFISGTHRKSMAPGRAELRLLFRASPRVDLTNGSGPPPGRRRAAKTDADSCRGSVSQATAAALPRRRRHLPVILER